MASKAQKDPFEKKDLSDLYSILGTCYVGLKNDRKSLELITRAIELSPSAVRLLEKLRDKRFDEAFQLIGIEDAGRLLEQIFRFGGQCRQCGKCCRDVMLFYDGKLIESEKEYEAACKMLPEYARFVPARTSNGRIGFACSKLSPSGRCLDYQNRPESCRIFPNYVTPNLKENCGYTMMLALDAKSEEKKDIKKVNAVALHLFRLGLYQKCVDLFGNI